jgi:hypothetical protein
MQPVLLVPGRARTPSSLGPWHLSGPFASAKIKEWTEKTGPSNHWSFTKGLIGSHTRVRSLCSLEGSFVYVLSRLAFLRRFSAPSAEPYLALVTTVCQRNDSLCYDVGRRLIQVERTTRLFHAENAEAAFRVLLPLASSSTGFDTKTILHHSS